MKKNLNGLMIAEDDGQLTRPLADPSVSVEAARVEAVFRNIPERLIALIGQHPVVIGCVAWLTHHGILAALAQCDTVSIVVQKEDFLRPDSDDAARCKEGFVKGVRCARDLRRWPSPRPPRRRRKGGVLNTHPRRCPSSRFAVTPPLTPCGALGSAPKGRAISRGCTTSSSCWVGGRG